MGLFTNENDLKKVFGLPKLIGKQPLSKVLESDCGYKIIPIDPNSPQDILLIKQLTTVLNKFIALIKKSHQRIHGNRINDIGKNIESLIESEMRKTPLEINKLGKSGYPDFEIKQSGRITYLELKITGNINKKVTHHRMFYFTSGKKIKQDARDFFFDFLSSFFYDLVGKHTYIRWSSFLLFHASKIA